MGQKVHTSIFRANIYPKYKNKWVYDKQTFFDFNIYVNIYLYLNKNISKNSTFSLYIINENQLKINYIYTPITIFTNNLLFKSNYKSQVNLNEYTLVLQKCITLKNILTYSKVFYLNLQITPVVLILPYFSPLYLANYIKHQLIDKKQKLKKIFKQIYILFLKQSNIFNSFKIKGIKISISGRIYGVQRAYSEHLNLGEYSLQTITNYIKFNLSFIKTSFGLLGVKVWVFYN